MEKKNNQCDQEKMYSNTLEAQTQLKSSCKYDDELIKSDPSKKLKGNIETDVIFAADMIFILQEKRSLSKKQQEDNHPDNDEVDYDFDDKTYNQIHQKALLHSQANKLNANTLQPFNAIQSKDKCLCGCRRGRGESLSIFEDQKNMASLGPGIILFFLYLRKTILLMLAMALTYGLYAIVVNVVKGVNYQNLIKPCQQSLIITKWQCQLKSETEFSNRQKGLTSLLIVQLIIGIFSSLMLIFGFKFIKLKGLEQNKEVDKLLDSSSDYSIQISDLPAGNYTEKQILNQIQKLYSLAFDGQKCRLKSVQIVYSMKEFKKLIAELNQLILKIGEVLKQVKQNKKNQDQQTNKSSSDSNSSFYCQTKYVIDEGKQNYYVELKESILKKHKEILEFREQFNENENFRMNKACDICFVEFQKQEQQKKFLSIYGSQLSSNLNVLVNNLISLICCTEQSSMSFKGSLIKIFRAPEPSDINWENCQKESKLWRVFIVWVITFFVIGLSFGALFLIFELKALFPEFQKFSIIVGISLQIFNRLIWLTLCVIVQIEQHNTKSDAIVSVMRKSCFAMAVNVLVLPIIMNIVLKDNFSGPSGLSGTALDYQLTIFFMMALWNLVNIPYQIKKIILKIPYLRNKKILQLSKIVGDTYGYKQIRDILKFYEQPQFPKAGMYVYSISTLSQAVFFSYIQPLTLFALIIGMAFFILINKYLIFFRCRIPPLIGLSVFQQCIRLSLRIPAYFGLGTLFFMFYTGQRHITAIALASLLFAVGVFGMIDPKQIIINFIKRNFFQQVVIRQQRQKRKKAQSLIRVKSKTIQQQIRRKSRRQSTDGMIIFNDINLAIQLPAQIQPQTKEQSANTGSPTKFLQLIQYDQQDFAKEIRNIALLHSKTQKFSLRKSYQLQRKKDSIIGMKYAYPESSDESDSQESKDSRECKFNTLKVSSIIRKSQTQQRKECYYQHSNLKHLFYFEKEFLSPNQAPSDLSKQFCHRFSARN